MTLDLVFGASAGKAQVGYFLLCTDLLIQSKRAILGAELRYGQQPGEDTDKSLQGALWGEVGQCCLQNPRASERVKEKGIKNTNKSSQRVPSLGSSARHPDSHANNKNIHYSIREQ